MKKIKYHHCPVSCHSSINIYNLCIEQDILNVLYVLKKKEEQTVRKKATLSAFTHTYQFSFSMSKHLGSFLHDHVLYMTLDGDNMATCCLFYDTIHNRVVFSVDWIGYQTNEHKEMMLDLKMIGFIIDYTRPIILDEINSHHPTQIHVHVNKDFLVMGTTHPNKRIGNCISQTSLWTWVLCRIPGFEKIQQSIYKGYIIDQSDDSRASHHESTLSSAFDVCSDKMDGKNFTHILKNKSHEDFKKNVFKVYEYLCEGYFGNCEESDTVLMIDGWNVAEMFFKQKKI